MPQESCTSYTNTWSCTSEAHLSSPQSPSPTAVFCLLVVFYWHLNDVLHLFLFKLNIFSQLLPILCGKKGNTHGKININWAGSSGQDLLIRLWKHFKVHHWAGLAFGTNVTNIRDISVGISILGRWTESSISKVDMFLKRSSMSPESMCNF